MTRRAAGRRAAGGLNLESPGGLGPEGVVWEPRVLQACWEGRARHQATGGDLAAQALELPCRGTRGKLTVKTSLSRVRLL